MYALFLVVIIALSLQQRELLELIASRGAGEAARADAYLAYHERAAEVVRAARATTGFRDGSVTTAAGAGTAGDITVPAHGGRTDTAYAACASAGGDVATWHTGTAGRPSGGLDLARHVRRRIGRSPMGLGVHDSSLPGQLSFWVGQAAVSRPAPCTPATVPGSLTHHLVLVNRRS